MGIFGFFSKNKKDKLDKGLEKTKENVFGKLSRAVAGKSKIDEEALDDIEEALLTSDIGVETTLKIIEKLEERVASDKYLSSVELNAFLKQEIANLLEDNHLADASEFDLPKGLADSSKTKIKINAQTTDKRSSTGYKQIEKE